METPKLNFKDMTEYDSCREAVVAALNLMRKRSADLVTAKFNPASAPDVLLADLPMTKKLHERQTKVLELLASKFGVL
jgi:hypothetical protein